MAKEKAIPGARPNPWSHKNRHFPYKGQIQTLQKSLRVEDSDIIYKNNLFDGKSPV